MQLEVGAVTEGKVTGITKFGAFVEIEKGVTGLVHISEISKSFIVDVSKILKCGDLVKVKVLSFENNKLSLSIKQVEGGNENLRKGVEEKVEKKEQQLKNKKEASTKKQLPLSFEEMLAKFKKTSEEKMSDIRKNLEGKRSSYSRKR